MTATYTPQPWADGDPSKPVSAARMTHIETGIAAVDEATQAAQAAVDAITIPDLADLLADGVPVSPGSTLLDDSVMGLDAPFGSTALRVINQNAGGTVQVVAPNGDVEFWAGGSEVAYVSSQGLFDHTSRVYSAVNPPPSYVPPNEFNVKDHGAVGNGTTDDSAAFTATWAAVAANGGGRFRIPGPATYALNVNIMVPPVDNVDIVADSNVVLKMKNAATANDNFVKIVNRQNVNIVGTLRIDGNKANQGSNTQYGFYVSGSSYCSIGGIVASNFPGVGVHLYNNTHLTGHRITSTSNGYHGMEVEQLTNSTFGQCELNSNTLHGLSINPGEVGGTGTHMNTWASVVCDSNGQYGLDSNASNDPAGARLNYGNVIGELAIFNSGQYGVSLYKQGGLQISNLSIKNSQLAAMHLYQSDKNIFTNVKIDGVSLSGAGWDAILIEGNTDGYASSNNQFGNLLIIANSGMNYAINEKTTADWNRYEGLNIIGVGTQSNPINLSTSSKYRYAGVHSTGGDHFSTLVNGVKAVDVDEYRVNIQTLLNLPVSGHAPSSATSGGAAGDVAIDSGYVYVCVATNSWKRTPLTAW